MTVREFVKTHNWQTDVRSESEHGVVVDVDFVQNGRNDQTQFDLESLSIDELEKLFNQFCDECGFRNDTVTGVTIVAR